MNSTFLPNREKKQEKLSARRFNLVGFFGRTNDHRARHGSYETVVPPAEKSSVQSDAPKGAS